MCKIVEELVNEEREDIEKKARTEASIDTARRMINEGVFTNEQISKISNLSLDEVEKLVKEHSA